MTNPGGAARAADHLANERTFLAWIRTSLGVIGLGFAIAKFGTWMRQLGGEPAHLAEAARSARGMAVGLAMIGAGGLMAALAAWRHRQASRQIDAGEVHSAGAAIPAVTLMMLILTAAVAWLVL